MSYYRQRGIILFVTKLNRQKNSLGG
ncbi:protein of unknown function (plasmid) [Lactiplantibacillus plantarum]